jgi:hypothetical protein
MEDNKKKRKAWRNFCSSFTYANEDEDDWLTCGFINYAQIKELQKYKFHKLMPFLVDFQANILHILYTWQCLKKWKQKNVSFAKVARQTLECQVDE